MVRNISYQSPTYQEEGTPLVTILETNVAKKQSTAVDSRQSPFLIDLAKSSFGGTHYPIPGSQWYVKKISSVWTLMARASRQNPQLDPAFTPAPGDTYIGSEGTTYVAGSLQGGMSGEVRIFAGPLAPLGWLLCNGSSLSRTTYARLFNVVAPTLGVATITIATPGVVTLVAHGLVGGDKIFFTTTGALPTGLAADTVYFVLAASITTDTFRVSLTDGGAAINTTGSQSGVHTLRMCPYGIADSTHFNAPDMRDRVPVGRNSATAAFAVIGKTGGAATHTLVSGEMPSHNHTQDSHNHTQNAHNHGITDPGHVHADVTTAAIGGVGVRDDYNSDAASTAFGTNTSGGGNVTSVTINNATPTNNATIATNQATGGGGAHNNLQPYIAINYIIKT